MKRAVLWFLGIILVVGIAVRFLLLKYGVDVHFHWRRR
jgi:hypothetical protein